MKKLLALMLLGALSIPTQKLEASKTAAAGFGVASFGLLGAALETEMRRLSPQKRDALELETSARFSKNPLRALKQVAHNRARFLKYVSHTIKTKGMGKALKTFPYLFGGASLAMLSASAATYKAVQSTGPDQAELDRQAEQARIRLEDEQRLETERLAATALREERERAATDRLTATERRRLADEACEAADHAAYDAEQQRLAEQARIQREEQERQRAAHNRTIISNLRQQNDAAREAADHAAYDAEQERLANLAAARNQQDLELGSLFGNDDDADDASASSEIPSESVLVDELDQILQDLNQFSPNASISASIIRGFGDAPEIPNGQPSDPASSSSSAQPEQVEIPSSSLVPPISSSNHDGSSDVSASFMMTLPLVDTSSSHASSSSPSTASPADELDALLSSEITAMVKAAFFNQVNDRYNAIQSSQDQDVVHARTIVNKAREKFEHFRTPHQFTERQSICWVHTSYISAYQAARTHRSIKAAEAALDAAGKKFLDDHANRIKKAQFNTLYQEALEAGAEAAALYTQRLHAYAQAKPAIKLHIRDQAEKLAVATEIATVVTQNYLETAQPTRTDLEILLQGIHAENIFAAAFSTVVQDLENQRSSDEDLIEHATDAGLAAIHQTDDSALRSFVAASESLLMSSRSTPGLPPSSSSSSSSSHATPPPPPAPPMISQHLKRIPSAQPKPAPLNLQDAIAQRARNLKRVESSSGRSSSAAAPSSGPQNAFDAMFGAMQQRGINADPTASLSLTMGNQSLLASSIMMSINSSRAASSEPSGMNWQAIDRLGDNQIIPSFLHRTLLDLRDELVTRNQRFTETIYGDGTTQYAMNQNVANLVKKIINIVGMQAYGLHSSVEYINARVRTVVEDILREHTELFRVYNPATQGSDEPILAEIARRYNHKMTQPQDMTAAYALPKTDFQAHAPSSSSSGAPARREEQLAQGAQQLVAQLLVIRNAQVRNDSDSDDDDDWD